MKALAGQAIILYQRRNGRSEITSNKKRKRRIVFRKQVYSYSKHIYISAHYSKECKKFTQYGQITCFILKTFYYLCPQDRKEERFVCLQPQKKMLKPLILRLTIYYLSYFLSEHRFWVDFFGPNLIY